MKLHEMQVAQIMNRGKRHRFGGIDFIIAKVAIDTTGAIKKKWIAIDAEAKQYAGDASLKQELVRQIRRKFKKDTRGGARPGSGRPRLPAGKKKKKYSVGWLLPDRIAHIRRVAFATGLSQAEIVEQCFRATLDNPLFRFLKK